ncbi:2-oxo-4-hydroxy-4-carboxy-5-ureidoimidazoline decarboxylase [Chroococcus sp. FPU101]|uniref:2-oxo-4-hydroxy-4-carboxy-5-ureidoimidazoline decarboxylase n=1 Tax=Chroococcus sp. FPU101 TaxID=1974212 RepID=UPI001A8FB9BC|nr:2-oxo-4-hydroxy-4-carboxy-5-ureidoimidazoline decarboxylase [Chroococcus sp. FPU101]GFE68036.1 OHCU decarboxylase [Chroococcus sp. FPU101]
MSYSLTQLNQMSQDEFVTVVGPIFEHTPRIAEQAASKRPFADVSELYQTMVKVVNEMSSEETLALIFAHPDLGTRAKMADASVKEQSGVGLDRLSPEEFDRFLRLNQVYRDRFGFPFIIAVRNHTQESILDAFEVRSNHSLEEEKQQALSEICQIARFRLEDLVTD